jgi:hypothetical protein
MVLLLYVAYTLVTNTQPNYRKYALLTQNKLNVIKSTLHSRQDIWGGYWPLCQGGHSLLYLVPVQGAAFPTRQLQRQHRMMKVPLQYTPLRIKAA